MAVTQNRDNNGQLINMYHSSETNMDYPSKEEAEKADTEAAKKNKLTKKMAEASKNGDSVDDLINKYYNSANGTWAGLYKAFKASGANDDTIAGIIKSKGLTGTKAQEWLKNYEKNKSQPTNTDTKTNTGMSDEEKAKQLDLLNTKLQLLYERKAQSDLSNEDYAAIDTQINKLKAEIESLETGAEVPPEEINPQLYNNGQIQHGIANKADELIEKYYNGEGGTWAKLYDALKAEGANDDTIAKIIVDKGLNGTKAQEWLKKYNKDYDTNARALGDVEFDKNQPVTKEALDAAKHKEYEDFKDDANKKVDDLANSESDINTDTPDIGGDDTSNLPGTGNSNLTTGDGGTDENKDKMAEFWKAFKAGAFRAYPMLQAIGDALSQQAKMTMDRANILTGKGSDLSVYEGKDPSEYFFNEDYEYRQAFLDAEAGNYEGVKELLLKGKVTLDQVAAALKLSEEDVEKIFGQEMRQREAGTVSQELANEETLKNEIRELDKQIAEVDKDINALQGNDVNTYLSVLEKYLNIHSGLDTTGSSTGSSTSKNDTAGGNIGGNAGNAVVGVSAGVSGSHAEGTTSTSNASRNKDLGALAALPKGKDFAQKSMEERNKANDELIANLKNYKQSLLNQKATAQTELDNIRTNQNAAQTGGKNKIVIPSSRDMTATTNGGNENVSEQPQQ